MDGKKYRFSFNPVLGVDFINKDGESIAISRYITDNDAVWEQFSKWYIGKFNNEEGKK